MMEMFFATPDPHFFDDVRNRIVVAISSLKEKKRRLQLIKLERTTQTNKGWVTEDDIFLTLFRDEEFAEYLSRLENDDDGFASVDALLMFLQNLCEGHFLEMKVQSDR